MQNPPAPPDLAYRFGLVVLGLCQVVANHVNRDCSNEPFIARIYFSLRRRLKRFERLFARVQAELAAASARDAEAPQAEAASAPAVAEPLFPAPPARKPATMATDTEREKTERKPYERLPRKRGWLTTMIPYKAALYWYRLDDLLRDPEMVAFLATSRQARRLLRPLWHSLCGDPLPACLREPPEPNGSWHAPVSAASDAGGAAEPGGGRHDGVGRRAARSAAGCGLGSASPPPRIAPRIGVARPPPRMT